MPFAPLSRGWRLVTLPQIGWDRIALFVLIVMVSLLIFVTALGPRLVSEAALQQNLQERLRPPGAEHPLGTDALGRDVLAQIVVGARWSVTVGAAGTLLGAVLGTLVGLSAGYLKGPMESLLMRAVDAAIAFPFMVLAVAVLAVLDRGFMPLAVTLMLGSWVIFARAAYAETLQQAAKPSIEAARALGAGSLWIMFRHIWPNISSSLVVVATFTFADLIIAESGLSFLGLGAPPGVISWGGMLNDGRGYMDSAWWLTVVPGLAIVLTVVVVNLLGDTLDRIFGPQK
jgi:peptide/nickel transport system permease protein